MLADANGLGLSSSRRDRSDSFNLWTLKPIAPVYDRSAQLSLRRGIVEPFPHSFELLDVLVRPTPSHNKILRNKIGKLEKSGKLQEG
jgi:hypothetical protein